MSARQDPRAVRHHAPAGAPHARELVHRPHVVVVGAGIAGLAAATGLAERGVSVLVLERAPQPGGRVASWTETSQGVTRSMSRGFHAFFRQYYNLRALLRRGDPGLERLVPLDDYPLVDAHGRQDSFRFLPRTPPWNALAFALRSPTFGLRDMIGLNAKAALPLAAVTVPDIYHRLDDVDADTFLRRINFPRAARHLAFDVFSRSFFAPPEELSAAELALMFHIYFLGSSEGLLFDVPCASFDTALWKPLRNHLAALAAEIRTDTEVVSVADRGTNGFRVRDATGREYRGDGVVLATDVGGLRRIVAESPALADPAWRRRVARLRSAPPFLVHRLWLDRPVSAGRPAFLGVGGLAPLDNISVLDRYESEARDWALAHGGSVVELHAYSAPSTGDLREQVMRRMRALYPETRTARVVAESAQWRDDCPHFGVGDFAERPTVGTPVPGLVLAGDGIRIDLPVALMERAASTGWHAANRLLAGWGLAGHDLWTVPTAGRVAPLRRLATRGG